MRKNKSISLIGIIWLLSSCISNSEFEDISDISNEIWVVDSALTFEFEIKEEGVYDIYYLVKNRTSYPYYNLHFKTNFRDKSSLISNKLQEVILFNKKTGEPYGKGLSGIMEHQFMGFPKQNLKKGKHTISLKQYMRINELRGVMAIGVKVIKSK